MSMGNGVCTAWEWRHGHGQRSLHIIGIVRAEGVRSMEMVRTEVVHRRRYPSIASEYEMKIASEKRIVLLIHLKLVMCSAVSPFHLAHQQSAKQFIPAKHLNSSLNPQESTTNMHPYRHDLLPTAPSLPPICIGNLLLQHNTINARFQQCKNSRRLSLQPSKRI